MKSFSKTEALWPGHPKPYSDETLSSWLARIAIANGMEAQDFVSYVLPAHECQPSYNYDYLNDAQCADLISKKVGTEANAFYEAGLTEFAQVLDGAWLIPARHTLLRPMQQYCRLCLSEAFFARKHWRLSFVTICPTHRTELEDYCAGCWASTQDAENLSRRRFQACRKHESPPLRCILDKRVFELQMRLTHTLSRGVAALRLHDTTTYFGSGQFLRGFSILVALLLWLLRENVDGVTIKQFGYTMEIPLYFTDFDNECVTYRVAIMHFMATVANRLGDNLFDLCRRLASAKVQIDDPRASISAYRLAGFKRKYMPMVVLAGRPINLSLYESVAVACMNANADVPEDQAIASAATM